MSKLAVASSVVLFAFVLGCGDSVPVQPVTGTVTVGGNPAPENTRVNFTPVGEGMAASGIVDSSGKFELFTGVEGLRGALPGNYKVFVTADASSASYMDSPQRGGVPGVTTGPFPKEYTSELTTPIQKEVVEGSNEIAIVIP